MEHEQDWPIDDFKAAIGRLRLGVTSDCQVTCGSIQAMRHTDGVFCLVLNTPAFFIIFMVF